MRVASKAIPQKGDSEPTADLGSEAVGEISTELRRLPDDVFNGTGSSSTSNGWRCYCILGQVMETFGALNQ